MAKVLAFPDVAGLLDLNQREIERATVEWQQLFRAVADAQRRFKDCQNALAELRAERQRLLGKMRR